MQSSHRPQSSRPFLGHAVGNGAVIGCGIVSGVTAPVYVNGHNFVSYTKLCQGQANRAEAPLSIATIRASSCGRARRAEIRSSSTPRTGAEFLSTGSPEWRSVMLQRMDTRINKFLATGAKVVLTLAAPAVHQGDTLNAQDESYAQMNSLLRKVAARHPHEVALVDIYAPGVSNRSAVPSRRTCLQPEADHGHADRPSGWNPLPAKRIAVGGEVAGAPDRPGGKDPLLRGWIGEGPKRTPLTRTRRDASHNQVASTCPASLKHT